MPSSYASANEVVRDALRSEVQQGLSSGPGSYAEDVFQRLERKYANQAREKINPVPLKC